MGINLSQKCYEVGTLIACINYPLLWIASVIIAIITLFYYYRFLYSIVQIRKLSFKETWPSILFWFSVSSAPTITLLRYIYFNLWDTHFKIFIFMIMRPAFIAFPYVSISAVILKLGKQLHTSKQGNSHYKRNTVILLLQFLFVVMINVVYFAIKLNQVSFRFLSITNLLTYLLNIFIFIAIALRFITQIQEIEISTLPDNFLRNIYIGLNAIIILNILHLAIHTSFNAWTDICGIPFKNIRFVYFHTITGLQFIQDIIATIIPGFILSIGIIYFNNLPSTYNYRPT